MAPKLAKRLWDLWRRRKRGLGLCGLALAAALLTLWAVVVGCRVSPRGQTGGAPAAPAPAVPPDQWLVRARIGGEQDRLTLAVDGPFAVLDESGRRLADSSRPLAEAAVSRGPGAAWQLGGLRCPGRRIEIIPDARRPGALRIGSRRYNGSLRLVAAGGNPGSLSFLAVNVLHVEDYVAGVVTAEMPASFGTEALKAQAVAARTYVMYEKQLHAGDDWDVTDDTSSQVYAGLEADRGIGRQVTDATRGQMLAFGPAGGERIFPAFFHSTCGGGTVSVRYIKPKVAEIRPISGGVPCRWCAWSPRASWPPVRVAKADLWPRLAAINPKLPADGPARKARIAEGQKDAFGRLLTVQVSWERWTVTMLADELRQAAGARTVPAVLARLTDTGPALVFSDGHGFGHGMGLCQYGAGGLARAGHRAPEILAYYYPGSVLKRAY